MTPILFAFAVAAFAGSRNDPIELVESFPEESVLDHPDIRDSREVWLEMLAGAKRSLDIEEFYVCTEKGEPMEEVLDAVRSAARRGVKVRIVSDSKFHKTYPEPLDSLAKLENVSVRFLDMEALAGGVMHAKYFIADGEHLFLGSQNFDWRSLKHIQELGLRVRDKAAAKPFEELFELDWALAQDPAGERARMVKRELKAPLEVGAVKLTPVFSPKGLIEYEGLWEEARLIELIDSAKREVLVQVLTYSPVSRSGEFHPDLDNALRRAAARGVEVRLIVSDWAKRPPEIHHLGSLAALPNVTVKLTAIPRHSKGYIPFARVQHAKFLVVDKDSAWLGSSNWSKDYFYASRNAGFIIQGKGLTAQLRRVFFSSWTGPYAERVDPAKSYEPPVTGD